jgi:hypothetical protein
MWRMRARAVIGSTLLLLSPLLASCGDEQDSTEAGDIIQGRVDNQFPDGKEASVTIPTGRLLIHAGEPVDSADGDETRTREQVDAPSGAVLVPLSWQYDPWDRGRLDGIVATTDTPVIDLVTDEEHYRLPPPQLDDKGGESFYVVVDGEAEKRSLQIEFDGVTQTVNLRTGKTDEGDAAALYDVDSDALKKVPCDEGKWFDSPTAVAEFTCDLFGPVLTPYAAGEWAPEGSLWLAVTVQTDMRVFGETNRLGGGARYIPRAVHVKAEIDGVEPAFELSTDDSADICPVAMTRGCGWSKHLVFEVPADDGEQGPLDLDVTYKMRNAVSWGGYDAPPKKELEAAEELKLWGD